MATQKNKYTSIDLSKYDAGYQASQDVVKAQQNKVNAENAVENYGDFNYANQAAYDQALNAITNRKKFSYDLNADALYQQYKDNYITQGKQAMVDTMGQAAALTGGYGNSYAATVGNQTYQGYLQNLNNVVPQLYQLALDKYNSEGEDLKSQFGVLQSDRQTQYGEWGDKYNRLVADRDYHSNEYNAAYGRDYTAWNDNRTYDTSQYWNEYNTGYQAEQDALQMAYQKERDAVTDEQWKKEYNLAAEQLRVSKENNSKVSYALDNYSDVTSELRGKLDKAALTGYKLQGNMPPEVWQKKNAETVNKNVATYLNGMVDSGEMSPELAKVLMREYYIEE